ncbi:hypothetical protein A3770_02p17440 [Chloropicon primus]|uniref:Uncharacterized protein n=4 Tax=Chloropicon primus TaxID=1764295 RepID=A0A5B8MFL1_9CHLO|nr:hypothetical protein A3770_02p17440 [Chloropicon primus]|eukprot:QDZ19226.1 hypothetical protein A3770_02p17440 [Chloropicon primus]
MNSLSGSALARRRMGRPGGKDETEAPASISEDALSWATVSEAASTSLASVKTVSFDPSSRTLFATHKTGNVLLWDWESGGFETFLAVDKDRDDMVHAVLCVGDTLWVSSGKGKIILYDIATVKTVTKVVAHTAEVFCMRRVSGTGVAKVLTGSIDFVVKIWDEDAMLVSHSSHHHGAILCAVQVRAPRLGRDLDHPQIWTGSHDGTVFKWNDTNKDGEVSKEEGATLKHATSEAVTCLEQVNDYIWAGTERGKLVIWDLDEEEPVCEIPAHKERISSVCDMGRSAWSAGADKVILGWSARSLPVRPKMLYKVDAEIGYVKNMIRINWGLWVFHSKGLAIYSAASSLEDAQDRCEQLLEEKDRLASKMKDLADDVAHGKAVEDSLEHQLRTLSARQEKAKAELANTKGQLADTRSELEEAKKKHEDSAKEASEDMQRKDDQAKAKEAELDGLKQKLGELEAKSRDAKDLAKKQEQKLAEELQAKQEELASKEMELAAKGSSAIEEKERLEGELSSKASELEKKEQDMSSLQKRLEEEKREKDATVATLQSEFEVKLQRETEAKEGEIEKLRAELQAKAEKEQREKEGEIAALKERMRAQLEAEKTQRDGELADLRTKLQAELDAEREDNKREIESLLNRIGELESRAENSAGENQKLLESKDREKMGLEQELAEALRGKDEAEKQAGSLQDQVSRNLEDIKRFQDQITGLNDKMSALESELKKRESELADKSSEVEKLENEQSSLRETSTKTLDDALAKSQAEREDMEGKLNTEIKGLQDKLADISRSRDEGLRDSEGKLREAEASVSSLQESLSKSETDNARLENENSKLAEDVKNLRSNHAKTLLLAGSKHQELLARSRKEMEEKSLQYEKTIEAKDAEIKDLQNKHSEACGEYEERLKEVEEARDGREAEMAGEIDKLQEELQEKEGECSQQRSHAQEKEEEYESTIRSKDEAHRSEVAELEGKVRECEDLLENQKGDLLQCQADYEEKLKNERDETKKIKDLYDASQATARLLEEDLGKILAEFDLAESRIKEYQEMVNALRAIHEEQAKIVAEKHEREKVGLRQQIADLKDEIAGIHSAHATELREQKERLEESKRKMLEKHRVEIESFDKRLEEQNREFSDRRTEILQQYKSEIELLNRTTKEVEQKLLLHIQRIEGEKKDLEAELSRTKEELQKHAYNEDMLSNKNSSLISRNDELEGSAMQHAAEKERIFMELEDLRSLVESTRGANPLAYANMFHPDGVDVALYMRTLKQDIFTTISGLNKDLGGLKHELDVRDKSIVSLGDEVKALEEGLEKKRKKKRKWKMAYLRLSATHAEELNGLQSQLQQTSDQLQNQQASCKKVQQALRQAAHQLQHAKKLEGALDQAQEEYGQLLTKLSSVRQQAESEKRQSQEVITALQSELGAKTRVFEQAMSEMNSEVNELKQMKRKQEQKHAAHEAALRYEEEARARRKKVVEPSDDAKENFKERERYSGFVC